MTGGDLFHDHIDSCRFAFECFPSAGSPKRRVRGSFAIVALFLNRVILNLCGAEEAFGP